jgi:hypothetical protein
VLAGLPGRPGLNGRPRHRQAWRARAWVESHGGSGLAVFMITWSSHCHPLSAENST